jgi:hypothetical protein
MNSKLTPHQDWVAVKPAGQTVPILLPKRLYWLYQAVVLGSYALFGALAVIGIIVPKFGTPLLPANVIFILLAVIGLAATLAIKQIVSTGRTMSHAEALEFLNNAKRSPAVKLFFLVTFLLCAILTLMLSGLIIVEWVSGGQMSAYLVLMLVVSVAGCFLYYRKGEQHARG